jgi:hypothetical protein
MKPLLSKSTAFYYSVLTTLIVIKCILAQIHCWMAWQSETLLLSAVYVAYS